MSRPEPPPDLQAADPSSPSRQSLTRPAVIAAAVLAVIVLVSVVMGGNDVDPEADKRRAERIVLTADDLPSSWSLAGAGEGNAGGFDIDTARRELEDCAPRAADEQLESEDATSPVFKGAGEAGAGSKAFVYSSAGDAEKSYGDMTSRRARDCVTDAFVTAFEPRRKELQLRDMEARSITLPQLGDGASAFRVKLTAGPREAPVAAYLDYVVLRADRTVAVLVFVSTPEPVSATDQHSAARAVVERMQA